MKMNPTYTPHVRTDQELRRLAMDIHSGKVFGTWCFQSPGEAQNCLVLVFMPLVFMDDKQREEMASQDVAHLFEYLDKAGPGGVNGYPCFTSFQSLCAEEWFRLRNFHEQVKEFEANFMAAEQ